MTENNRLESYAVFPLNHAVKSDVPAPLSNYVVDNNSVHIMIWALYGYIENLVFVTKSRWDLLCVLSHTYSCLGHKPLFDAPLGCEVQGMAYYISHLTTTSKDCTQWSIGRGLARCEGGQSFNSPLGHTKGCKTGTWYFLA